MRIQIVILLVFMAFLSLQSQDLLRYDPIKAEIRGESINLEQVLQTQLTLPKNNLNSSWKDDFTVVFLLDSIGYAKNLLFQEVGSGVALQKEIKRIFRFLQFTRADKDPKIPYYLHFSLSSEKYFGYQKQKQKNIKASLPADSSYIIYTRADRSPDYFKGGEEALKEFLMTELEYPKLAIEKSVEGTVVVEFIVETNGFITNLSIKQSVGAGCNDEALRLIRKTRWQPAQLNGKLVRYRMTYPITFGLRNVTRDTGL